MAKIINSRCICGNCLPWKNTKILMILPCEHLLHKRCYNFFIKKIRINKYICPLCHEDSTGTCSQSDINTDKITCQQYIDILSMSCIDDNSVYFFSTFTKKFLQLMGIFSSIVVGNSKRDGYDIFSKVFRLLNARVHITGKNLIERENKKIFIANHTCYLDMLLINRFFKTGFLASAQTAKDPFGQKFMSVVPCLVIDRSKTSNDTVHKMHEYVENNGSLCIFPEGMFTHPDTIITFRTGAFNVGFPIYALVIKYRPLVADGDVARFILKLASQQELEITVDVLGPYYPPFTSVDIEKIRADMAKKGRMFLSRVSNRDIHELKN